MFINFSSKRIINQIKFRTTTTTMPPTKPKRKKLQTASTSSIDSSSSENSNENFNQFLSEIQDDRNTFNSIMRFNFLKKRVRILSVASEVKIDCDGIVYWMSRDCRVQDNWSFLYAQKLAIKNEVPLHVCFCLVRKFLDATIRHYKFLLKGLEEVKTECDQLKINFHLLPGDGGSEIPKFVTAHNIGAVVCDFSPLRLPLKWVEDVRLALPEDIPLCQVDAHNIIPVWVTSDKQEYSARTIRSKIDKILSIYLTKFPPVIVHPFASTPFKTKKIDWKSKLKDVDVDRTIDEVEWATPGYTGGIEMLKEFCDLRLELYGLQRNDPLADAVSNLSPWFHFGQISVQRCVLAVQKFKSTQKHSVDAFCEEAIVRRELADNFCFYNENYDNLKGLAAWAFRTLDDHRFESLLKIFNICDILHFYFLFRKDERAYLYTKKELEISRTHDDLWNSAQNQLRDEGKMHGFLRMYWAKKILEWTTSPEKALEIAIYLNDRYSLDGRDPNGYVG